MKKLIMLCLVMSFSFADFSVFAKVGLCGEYLKGREVSPSKIKSYVSIFVTGINFTKDRVTNIDMYSQLLFLDNYCKKNPLNPFFDALDELDQELDKN